MSGAIAVGQVWRSRDKRDRGRTVTVEEVRGDVAYGNGFVIVRNVRRSQMRAHTLLSRYDLLNDACTTPTTVHVPDSSGQSKEATK